MKSSIHFILIICVPFSISDMVDESSKVEEEEDEERGYDAKIFYR